jgi:hypothetical protein
MYVNSAKCTIRAKKGVSLKEIGQKGGEARAAQRRDE